MYRECRKCSEYREYGKCCHFSQDYVQSLQYEKWERCRHADGVGDEAGLEIAKQQLGTPEIAEQPSLELEGPQFRRVAPQLIRDGPHAIAVGAAGFELRRDGGDGAGRDGLGWSSGLGLVFGRVWG